MSVSIGVLKEASGEGRRVACTPDMVRKYRALGASVNIQSGAGEGSFLADDRYAEAGAVVTDRAAMLASSDILLCIQPPNPASLIGIQPGAWLVGKRAST